MSSPFWLLLLIGVLALSARSSVIHITIPRDEPLRQLGMRRVG